MSQAQKDLVDSGQRGSMFEVYFRHNKAWQQMTKKEFLNYWEMPEDYRWNGNTSLWEQRIRRLSVIGRIYNVIL